mgnify:CR=1 FL=1
MMTRDDAIANWQQGINLVSKATTVEEPFVENPPKVNSVTCWNNWFNDRKNEFLAGVTLLKSVVAEGPLDPPNYTEIAAITEIAPYWTYLKQFGVDFINAHPEIYPVE